MGADSPARRLAKRVLHPLLDERVYRFLQAGAMAWDIRRGNWRDPELVLLPDLVRAGDTVIDIGANYGLYSYHLSHLVGPTGRVYAFEPIPFTAATFALVARVLRFRNVTLFKEGASDRTGEVSFELPIQSSGALTAGQAHASGRDDERPGKERHHRYPATRQITCPIVRIDDRVPPGREVSFIKADIEGAELLAFRGATRIIDRDRPTVLCEINTWFLEGFGIRLDELLGFFSERGYGSYVLDAEARRLRPVTIGPDTEDNFFFVHPRRRDRLAAVLADG
jgi:FkbM family methyltransferase